MAAITVGATDVVEFDMAGMTNPVIQNLGPGVVYFGIEPDVDDDTGVQLAVGAAYEFRRVFGDGDVIYLISSQSATSVRTLVVA